jgi:hypothetical protein
MKDKFTNKWITKNSIEICSNYEKGVLTLRGLHYQLVGLGMTNDLPHYKRVVAAMIDARWEKLIAFDQFSDLDRTMVGSTESNETDVESAIDTAKDEIINWMRYYNKNRWENQPYYPEVFIEKKALQGVFQPTCNNWGVALGACKGYPSLTFLHEASRRFKREERNGKKPIILYFGDYDASGEDIPRSIYENFLKFDVEVEVKRIALMKEQVVAWKLPPAPSKPSDTRTANWGGLGQVELDAVKPEQIVELCEQAIREIFDNDLHDELLEKEAEELKKYRKELKEYVINITD